MTGEEARRNGPWKGKKGRHNALSPVFSFPAALHLATVLISDALRVRASSSYYRLDTPPQVRLSIFETKMATVMDYV